MARLSIKALAGLFGKQDSRPAPMVSPSLVVPNVSVSCYLRNRVAYIPTFGREESGWRRMVDPVAVVPLTEGDALRQAIKAAVLRGEPSLPTLDRRGRLAALPSLPRLAGVSSWSSFYFRVAIWQIDAKDGAYRITPKNFDLDSEHWVLNDAEAIVLPLETTLDALCDRAVEIFAPPPPPPKPSSSPIIRCYLRQGLVYVPTFGRDPFTGMYRMVEPIARIPTRNTSDLRAALKERFLAGNPTLEVRSPPQRETGDTLLAIAGAKSLTEFDRSCTGHWQIDNRANKPEIRSYRIYSKKGGWVVNEDSIISLPAGTDLDVVCDRLIEIMQAAVPPASGVLEPNHPSAVETLLIPGDEEESYVTLPSSPDRIDELADFLEWIANVEPEEAPAIRSEIKRYYYDHGDKQGGDALHQALEEALVTTNRLERAKILDRFECYVQEDWVTANWTWGG